MHDWDLLQVPQNGLGRQGLLQEGCRHALLARQQRPGLECGSAVGHLTGGNLHAWIPSVRQLFWPKVVCHHRCVLAAQGLSRARALLQVAS